MLNDQSHVIHHWGFPILQSFRCKKPMLCSRPPWPRLGSSAATCAGPGSAGAGVRWSRDCPGPGCCQRPRHWKSRRWRSAGCWSSPARCNRPGGRAGSGLRPGYGLALLSLDLGLMEWSWSRHQRLGFRWWLCRATLTVEAYARYSTCMVCLPMHWPRKWPKRT